MESSVPLISTLQEFEMRGTILASENIFALKVATVTIHSAPRYSGISRQSCWGVGESWVVLGGKNRTLVVAYLSIRPQW